VDQATFFAVMVRGWQFLSGPITIFLIAVYFSRAMQGYYYAFMPILAAQLFFELSLHVVIINSASHEWASLETDATGSVTGDAVALSRLAGLVRFTSRWYAVVSLLFVVAIGVIGVSVLSKQSLPASVWMGPWIATVISTGLMLLILPYQATLEGCGQLPIVNRYRLAQAITGTIVVAVCIASGLGLWAIAASSFSRLIWELILVAGRYRPFFRSLFSVDATSDREWLHESWPCMWRLAVQGVAGYFAMHLVTLVIFSYHGDEAGGRFGMTWQILTALQAGAFAWVETRRPLFGILIARREFGRLDELWLRLSSISTALFVTAVVGFVAALWVLQMLTWPIAEEVGNRMLPLMPTLMLGTALVALHVPRCQNIYIRAHKRDPFLIPGLVVNASIGGLVWYLGRRFGATGVAAAYLGVIVLVQFPVWWIIWNKCRREWHTTEPTTS
jgi:hypothetical protein